MGFNLSFYFSRNIPKEYLYSSKSQRTALFQGLMDAKGEVNLEKDGCIIYTSIYKSFIRDVEELGRSLGCICISSNNINTKGEYQLTIYYPDSIQPFYEKKGLTGLPENSDIFKRYICKVDKIAVEKCQCITIDHPDHLYLTDGFAPTHNCVAGKTKVLDPKTLRPVYISDLKEAEETYVFDFKKNKLVKSKSKIIDEGLVKDCLELTFDTGEKLTLSTDHLLLDKEKGWIATSNFKAGDFVLQASEIPIFGDLEVGYEAVDNLVGGISLSKEIPDEVFSYTKDSLRSFVTSMWAFFGRFLNNDNLAVFLLWNENLALDFQHILLRFGINSFKDSDHNLFIRNSYDVKKLLQVTGLEVDLFEVKAPRQWRHITGIKHVGEKRVYDLSVSHKDHNFIANNIVVHNSFAADVIALYRSIIFPNELVVYLAPTTPQIRQFFRDLDRFLSANELLSSLVTKKPNQPYPMRQFANGSEIVGYPIGSGDNDQSEKLRGQTPGTIIIDEAQDASEESWRTTLPFMIGNQYNKHHVKSYIQGTITKDSGHFYQMTYTPPELLPPKTDVIFIPITDNPEWDDESIKEIKESTTDSQWKTEYMLEPSTQSHSVFRIEDIQRAMSEEYHYGPHLIKPDHIRTISADWDSVNADTHIMVTQYNPLKDELQVINAIQIPRSKFVYSEAVDLMLDWFIEYKAHFLSIDSGDGRMQRGELILRAPSKGLEADFIDKRLEVVSFRGNYQLDSEEGVKKIMIKHHLVNRLAQRLQRTATESTRSLYFSSLDKTLHEQLAGYKVISKPGAHLKFSSFNEHFVDCLLFAEHILHTRFGQFMHILSLERGNIQESDMLITTLDGSQFSKDNYQESDMWGVLEGGSYNSDSGNFIPGELWRPIREF
jgi:intein/homing endonuclease